MSEKIKRCAIYIRVSTSEQMMHGKSIEAQREYLACYAKDHGMIVTGVYADEGKTARKELKKRKAIHALLEDVKAGKIDVILFWRLDRWFRNMSDFYKVQDILDEYGVYWISASEPGINMETRDGRLQLNVVLSIGQNEVDTTSERIKFVNEASIRQGKVIFGENNMPRGYKVGIVDGKKCMVKDPEQEEMVNAFYDYFEKHQAKQQTLRFIQRNYDPAFSYGMLRTMLSSEFYKGTYRGIPYCPAYLSEERWAHIQNISKKSIRRPRSGRDYCYYRCNRAMIDRICTNQHRVSQNLIESYLLDNLENEFKTYKIRVENVKQQKKKAPPVRTEKQIDKELDRLNLLFQKGRIEWDYYSREYDSLEKEKEDLNSVTVDPEPDYSFIETLLQQDIRGIYRSLTPENKRAFWKNTIRQIYLKPDYTIDYVDFI